MKIFKIIAAKVELFQLREQYKANMFNGHPEYMLDRIASVEDRIKQLRKRR